MHCTWPYCCNTETISARPTYVEKCDIWWANALNHTMGHLYSRSMGRKKSFVPRWCIRYLERIYFTHIFLIHSGKWAATTAAPWHPCLSSTLMLSPPQSTISCNTMGILSNTRRILPSRKCCHASCMMIAIPSGSLCCSWCLRSTIDWMLIQMPKSKAFTSGEHADCCIISILKSSLNLLVYSFLASCVPCPQHYWRCYIVAAQTMLVAVAIVYV